MVKDEVEKYQPASIPKLKGDLKKSRVRVVLLARNGDTVSPALLIESAELKIVETVDGVKPWWQAMMSLDCPFHKGVILVLLGNLRIRDVRRFTSSQSGGVGSVSKLLGKYDLLSGQRESVRFPCKKDTSWEEAPLLVNPLTSLAPALFPLELHVGQLSILWALDTTREDVSGDEIEESVDPVNEYRDEETSPKFNSPSTNPASSITTTSKAGVAQPSKRTSKPSKMVDLGAAATFGKDLSTSQEKKLINPFHTARLLWYVRTTHKSDLMVPQDAAVVRAYHTNTFLCITVA
ncbi:hypothetical protein E2C01_032946 [Portunus trituberculatus]|uniref:Uncharacterized protein n=1 Tax=Portunus trituberculatus TaxID=210409 RepID=A0A5B7EWI9_PORTR|nr:hypothetical protein [Portunus trituberculatus]